jgi:uncharacterized protein YqgQ
MTSSVFQCFGHRRIRATSSIVLLRVPPGTFAIRTGYDVRSVYVRYGVAVIAGNRKANIRIPIEVSFIFKQRASSQSYFFLDHSTYQYQKFIDVTPPSAQ